MIMIAGALAFDCIRSFICDRYACARSQSIEGMLESSSEMFI